MTTLQDMEQAHSTLPRVVRYRPASIMRPHRHDEPWFCILLRGDYQERVVGTSQPHDPGDMMFCPANTEHGQEFGPNGALKVLFSPAAEGLSFMAAQGVRLDDAPWIRSATAMQLGARLIRELKVDDPFTCLSVEGLLLELTAIFARAAQRSRDDRTPAWLAQAYAAIQDADVDALRLAALAQSVGRHPVHLAREFRRYYGRTIGDLLREKRVRRAARLIQTTSAPLAQIALACGYADQAALSRAFRAVYGATPASFRSTAH